MKQWLAAKHRPDTVAGLQTQLDAFVIVYNQHRPHTSLQKRTPQAVYDTLPKATPGQQATDSHYRLRTDTVDKSGTVTLRHAGKLHHIGIGRTHSGTHIIMLIEELNIRVVNKTTGEILRKLTLNPNRNYQPQSIT